eukprot:4601361-Pyramimonas_sp.AAC.1
MKGHSKSADVRIRRWQPTQCWPPSSPRLEGPLEPGQRLGVGPLRVRVEVEDSCMQLPFVVPPPAAQARLVGPLQQGLLQVVLAAGELEEVPDAPVVVLDRPWPDHDALQ